MSCILRNCVHIVNQDLYSRETICSINQAEVRVFILFALLFFWRKNSQGIVITADSRCGRCGLCCHLHAKSFKGIRQTLRSCLSLYDVNASV